MTMGVLEKLRIRQAKSVKLPNGETVFIRTLSIGEHRRSGKLTKDQQLGFFIGSVLVEESGSRVYPQKDGESDAEFSERIIDETDIDLPSVNSLMEAHKELERTPRQSVLEKNSESTSTPTLP